MPETNVMLNLAYDRKVSPDELEAATFDVLAAVEERCSDVALDPAISCDFETSTIELAFQVTATSSTDVHRQITKIVEAIEEGTPLEIAGTGTRSSESTTDPGLVAA